MHLLGAGLFLLLEIAKPNHGKIYSESSSARSNVSHRNNN
jgi:hypothetical protein